jgi:6-phosphofructokinase
MKPRIGVLTSGGDCPGLNAVLRGVVLASEKLGWEVVGFRDGFEGLLPPGNHIILDRQSINGIMALGGTIIGTAGEGVDHCRRRWLDGDCAAIAGSWY